MALPGPVVTNAGIAALAEAIANATAVDIVQVALGDGQYTPNGAESTLASPFNPAKTLPIHRAEHSDVAVTLFVRDTSTDAYTEVGEIGVFGRRTPLAALELLAIISRPAADGYIASKAADAETEWAIVIALTRDQSAAITVTQNVTAVPAATRAVSGRVQFADDTTLDAGTSRTHGVDVEGAKRVAQAQAQSLLGDLPTWTTATRPVLSASQRRIGYNETLGLVEHWNGSTWRPFSSPQVTELAASGGTLVTPSQLQVINSDWVELRSLTVSTRQTKTVVIGTMTGRNTDQRWSFRLRQGMNILSDITQVSALIQGGLTPPSKRELQIAAIIDTNHGESVTVILEGQSEAVLPPTAGFRGGLTILH